MKKINTTFFIVLFLFSTALISFLLYYTSVTKTSFLSHLIFGAIFAFSLLAPIIRLKYGEIRGFPLKAFAVFPLTFICVVFIPKSASLVVFPIGLLQIGYWSWLGGDSFLFVFKRSTWTNLFDFYRLKKEIKRDKEL
jgi:hypothetical protein